METWSKTQKKFSDSEAELNEVQLNKNVLISTFTHGISKGKNKYTDGS